MANLSFDLRAILLILTWLISEMFEVMIPKQILPFVSAMRIRQNPLWLWNPEETSPEIQNRGTSGPKTGHVKVSDKKTWKKKFYQETDKS